MQAKELWVEHAGGRYPIKIGESFDKVALQQAIDGRTVCIVTNATVAPLYLVELATAIGITDPVVCELPDGEQFKTAEHWMAIFDALTANRCHRDSVIVALGGGVVGDMAGFAAACYQRGVDCIQVPTTLLSQVDSSIGGKTAINHPAGKNLIGAFYQPKLVVINTQTLQSLPQREYRAGFGEIIKAGIIADESILRLLETESDALLQQDPSLLQDLIHRACLVKQRLVEQDEQDTQGPRALLNLGHTFAHAIEHYFGYGEWLHGEAVALGLVLSSGFSVHHKLCGKEFLKRVQSLVNLYGLPTSLPQPIDCVKLCSIMMLDKKVQQGRLRMVLPRDVEHCVLTLDYSVTDLRCFLETLQA
jgi:3-dehydroquinate synthase